MEGGYNHVRCIVQQGQNLEEEENNLMKAFMGNGSFICSASASKPLRQHGKEREEEWPPTVHLPYVAGVSERTGRVCKNFDIRVVFKSRPTLRPLLTKVKNPLPMEKQADIVYKVPYAPVERCTSARLHVALKHV